MRHLIRLCRGQWDRSTAVVLVAAGVVALVAGWARARETVLAYEQMPLLISGGLGGLALIAVGAGCWISADLRDEWRKLDRLEAKLDGLEAPARPELKSVPPAGVQ